MAERNSKEIDDCRAFEKWAHWLLLREYSLDSISEEKEPLLYLYLLKAKKLEERYAKGYSSSVLESMYEKEILEELAEEQERKHSKFQATSDIIVHDTAKAVLKRLSFPFDQVSEGIFLGYLMEILLKQKKDTYVALLKKDVMYEIQMIQNLNLLLNILREEFSLEIDDLDVSAESLMTDIDTVNDLFSLLFQKFVLEADLIKWKDQMGEDALSAWCKDCISVYPGGAAEKIDFDEGFYSGVAFCYILHSYSPEHIDLNSVHRHDPQSNLKQAFEVSFHQFNISHIIQNFNINRSTILLFLSMLFVEIAHISSSTFESREVAAGIRRKVFYMSLQQEYYDVSMTISDTMKRFEIFLKGVESSKPQSDDDVERLIRQFQKYRKEKLRVVQMVVRLFECDHNLRILTMCRNKFDPYEPPGHLSLPRLLNSFGFLLPHEMKFNANLVTASAMIMFQTDLSLSYQTQYSVIQEHIQKLNSGLVEINSIDDNDSLQDIQERHDMTVSISITTSQVKARLSNLKLMYNRVHQKKTISYEIHNLERSLSHLIMSTSQQQARLAEAMTKHIESEALRVKYRLLADEFGLSIAYSMVLLSSSAIDPPYINAILPTVREELSLKESTLKILKEIERQMTELHSNDPNLPSATDLERFYNDLKLLVMKKESLIDETDKIFLERNESIKKLMAIVFRVTRTLERLKFIANSSTEGNSIVRELTSDLEELESLKTEISTQYEQRNNDEQFTIFTYEAIMNHWESISNIIHIVCLLVREKVNSSSLSDKEVQKLQYLIDIVAESFSTSPNSQLHVDSMMKENEFVDRVSLFADFINLISPDTWSNSADIPRVLESFSEYFSKYLRIWCSVRRDDTLVRPPKQMTQLQNSVKECVLKQENSIPRFHNLQQIIDCSSEISACTPDLIEYRYFSRFQSEEGNSISDYWNSLQNRLHQRASSLIDECCINRLVVSPDMKSLVDRFRMKVEVIVQRKKVIEDIFSHKEISLVKLLTHLADLQSTIGFFSSFSLLFNSTNCGAEDFRMVKTIIEQIELAKDFVKDCLATIKRDVARTKEDQVLESKYNEFANSILLKIEELREKIVIQNGESTYSTELESIEKQLKELERLNIERNVGFQNIEYGVAFLRGLQQHVIELLEQRDTIQSVKMRKRAFSTDQLKWIAEQHTFIHDWISKVKEIESCIQNAQSVDDLMKCHRLVEHRKQETKLIEGIVDSLPDQPDKQGILILVSDACSTLHLLSVLIVDIEADYQDSFIYDQSITFEIERMKTLNEILKNNKVQRGVELYGRTPISMLTSLLDDCRALKEHSILSAQVVSRTFPPKSSCELVSQLSSSIKNHLSDFRELLNNFNQEYGRIMSELESLLRTETDLKSLSSSYAQAALVLFDRVNNCVREKVNIHSDAEESISKMIQFLEEIDHQLSGRALQVFPVSLLKKKIKRCLPCPAREQVSDHHREKQLTKQIVELLRNVTRWIDQGIHIEGRVQCISEILGAEQTLEQISRLIHDEIGQYNHLVRIISLYIELSLSSENTWTELEELIRSVEIKWIRWLKQSRQIIRMIEEQMEELLINEERKNQIQQISSHNLEEWLYSSINQLSSVLATKVNNRARLCLTKEELKSIANQKESMLITFENMKQIYHQISNPDPSLTQYQQKISHLWKTMSNTLLEIEEMVSDVSDVLNRSTEQRDQLIDTIAKFIILNSDIRQQLCSHLRNSSSEAMEIALSSFEAETKVEIQLLVDFIQRIGGEVYSELIENHWNCTLFLVDRFIKRAKDMKEEEKETEEKKKLLESKCVEYCGELQLITNRVSLLRKESNTAREAEEKLEQISVHNSHILRILSQYSSLLESFDDIEIVQEEEQLENLIITTLKNLDVTFTFVGQEFDILKKYEVLSSTYSALFQTISLWTQRYEDSRHKTLPESVDNICSSRWSCDLYFSQRVQISLLLKQLTLTWTKLTSMGIYLKFDLTTPSDLKKRIDKMDRYMKKKHTKYAALLEQFQYVLAIRNQWFDSAVSLSSWIRGEISYLFALLSSNSPNDSEIQLNRIEKLRLDIPKSQTKYQFLLSLRTSMIEQCVLLPSEWDSFLLDISNFLNGDLILLEKAASSANEHLTRVGSSQADLERIKDRYSNLFLSLSRRVKGLRETVSNLNSESKNLQHMNQEYYQLETELRTLIALYDFLQQITFKKAVKSSMSTFLSSFQELGKKLQNLAIENKTKYHELSVIISRVENLDDFFSELCLDRWVCSSLIDLSKLVDRLSKENVTFSTMVDNIVTFSIFKQELSSNQKLKDHLINNNLTSDEILQTRWLELDQTMAQVVKCLTRQFGRFIEDSYDKGSMVAISRRINDTFETMKSKPLVEKEKNFLQELAHHLDATKQKTFIDQLNKLPIDERNRDEIQLREIFSLLCRDYEQLFNTLTKRIVELLDNSSPGKKFLSDMDILYSQDVIPALRNIHQRFEDTLDDTVSKSLMSCLNALAERFKSIIENLQQESDSVSISIHSLSMISSEYEEWSETLIGELGAIQTKLDNMDDEESVNDDEIEITSTVGRAYIVHTLKSGISLPEKYRCALSLRVQTVALCKKFSSLSLLYLERVQKVIDGGLELDMKHKVEDVWHQCLNTLDRIDRVRQQLLANHLNSTIRPLNIEREELTSWYRDALSTMDQIFEVNSYYDSQLSLLDLKILHIQHEYYEERATKYITVEKEKNYVEELSRLRKQVLNKMLDLPSVDSTFESVVAHQAYESSLQKQACDLENVDTLLDSLVSDIKTMEDKFSEIQNDNHNLKSLKQKKVELHNFILEMELIESRSNTARDLLEHVIHKLEEEKDETLSDVTFTTLTKFSLREKLENVERLKTKLQNEHQCMQTLYDQHSTYAGEYVGKFNNLQFWFEQNLVLLLPEKTKIIDSSEIIQLLEESVQSMRMEYVTSIKANYSSICDEYRQVSLNRERNDNRESFIRDAVELYGIIGWEEMKDQWHDIQNEMKKRSSELDREERERRDIQQKYNVPKDIVDVVKSSFMHFAKNNRTTDETTHIHYEKLSKLLRALGMKFQNENEVSQFLNNATPHLEKSSALLSFDDLMLFISNNVRPIMSAQDMKAVLNSLTSKCSLSSWTDVRNFLAASLTTHDIRTLYTMIRFVPQGIDLNKLADDVFTS